MDAQASAPGRTVTLWHDGELVHDPTLVPAITLNAEENKIRQVLANLLQNALRFSPDDTPIEVIVEKEDNPARGVISVVDHGEGIPLQLRDKIFQRLFRADTSRARDTGGSGLGLAIVDTIVRRHKGTIRVDETPAAERRSRCPSRLSPTSPRRVLCPTPHWGGIDVCASLGALNQPRRRHDSILSGR